MTPPHSSGDKRRAILWWGTNHNFYSFNAVVGKLFPTCEKTSIDYAVMEKSKEIYTLPAEFGWSDLGSWGEALSEFEVIV